MTFEQELSALINKHSIENQSDTPDFLLARFLIECLDTWSNIVRARDAWYNFDLATRTLGP
jgi:hypothetical protein